MVKAKQKMGPKLEGKVVKKGRRGAKKPKGLKLQAEDEEVALNPGNAHNMGDEAGNGREGDDLALLSKPVEISVTGVRQLLKMFQSTTVEVQDLLSTECDLVYECKVCRSLYRSVANFVSHKRSYCKEQYSDIRHIFSTSHRVEDQLVIIQPEPVPEMPSSETWKTSDSQAVSHPSVTSDGNNLVTAEIEVSVPPISSYIRPKRNLSQIVEDLVKKLPNDVSSEPVGPVSAVQFYTSACEKVLAQRDARKEQTLHLEPMQGASCVFQTVIPPASSVENTDLMKTQVEELHGMVSANEATLGPVGEITVINGEGKTLPVDTSLAALKKVGKRKCTPYKSKTGITCNICNLDFETRKTFLYHNNKHHAASRVHYPCPCCRDTFANAWNVYRHLYKVHRKSSAQVRRLRSKVLNKVYLGKVAAHESQCTKKKPKTVEVLSEADKVKQEQERMEKENEDWMQNLEDDLGLQMCGGCGRRFERRAALNSHSQTCAKRIEVRKKSNRFYPISTVGSSSNIQNSNTKVPFFMERAHTTRSEVLLKPEMGNTENISSRLTPVSTHSEGTMSSGAKSGPSPAHSPLPPESTFSVPIPPVAATMYLRSPNSNGNPEKKIEIQIRRNYFKTEMGSVSASTAIGSTGSGLPHSLGKSGYHGTFPTVASTSGKLLEATSSSFQQTISEQGKKEIVESSLPLKKLGNADEGYEVDEPKSHSSLPLGLDSNTYLSSCEIETSSSEYSKPPMKLNKIKEISKCHVKKEHVEDSYEQAASKMRYWKNYSNQNEYSVEEFHLQEDCIVKDEVQDNELISEFNPQKSFVGNVEQNLGKNEAGVRSSKSTTFKSGVQIKRQMKNRKKGRKGKYECYTSCMINGKKRECVMCHKRYNKVACGRRQVAFKIGYYRFQCMLCDSRYLSRALCLAHIRNEHDIHETKAPFQQKCIKIMLHHSKALRLRSARMQKMGRKSSANDSDAVSSIIVGEAEESTKILADAEKSIKIFAKESCTIQEESLNKEVKLPEEKYSSKIQTANDENGNQHLAMFRKHCDVRTHNEESKELAIEDSEVSSVVAQEKGSTNRCTVVKNTENNDTDPKQGGSYTLLYSEDRTKHYESETLFTKPKAEPFLHTSPVDSDLILSEVSIQKRETGYPECEANYKKGMMEHDGAEKVGECKKFTKRRLRKVKHSYKRRKSAVSKRMDTILEFDEKYKPNEQSNTPAHQNSPDIIAAGLERMCINTTENAAAGTSKQKEIIAQNTSVAQSTFKVLGRKSSMTEIVIKDEVEEKLCSDEASEKHTSREKGNGKRSKLSKVIKPETDTGTFHPFSNSGDEIISGEACQLAKQVSGVTKTLPGELKMLPPVRRSRRLSGQEPECNADPFVDLAKRTNCQDNRHDQERSSSPNPVLLAKKCRTSTRGNLMNIESNIASLKPLNDLEDKSNSNFQCCEVHEVMKQDINLICETDFSQDAVSESCNGSVAKDGNYPLPMNSDYANEAREDNNQRKLRKTKSRQKRVQRSVTVRKYGSTVDEKQSCLTVSDFGSDEMNNVNEKGLDREEAGAEELVLQKTKIKSNKESYLRPIRKGKMKLHNPADLENAEPESNRAELVDTNIMGKRPILKKEPGIETSSDLEPSAESPSSGGETNELQKANALRKMVMQVIFGTGQDCDTTQQQLSATLNGKQYDSQYGSSPSSSSTSPSSSACSPGFSVNDPAASEEPLKIKDEGKIMPLKKTVLNSFPEKKQRPVRNRIKLEREDFIYDLPDRYRDIKRENEDRLSSCSSVTRSRQQTDLASSSVASSSDSTPNLQNIPKLVLVRTNTSVQAAKLGNDNSSLSTENLVGASETFGAGSVAYKISKRKSQVQDAKCKLAASSKERTD